MTESKLFQWVKTNPSVIIGHRNGRGGLSFLSAFRVGRPSLSRQPLAGDDYLQASGLVHKPEACKYPHSPEASEFPLLSKPFSLPRCLYALLPGLRIEPALEQARLFAANDDLCIGAFLEYDLDLGIEIIVDLCDGINMNDVLPVGAEE